MPVLRGKIMEKEPKVGHFDDSAEVLQFACSRDLAPGPLGTSCPDHFLRTKIRPLVLDLDSEGGVNKLLASIDGKLEPTGTTTRGTTSAASGPTAQRCAIPTRSSTSSRGGMLSYAKDKATARIAGEFYVNAINVMRAPAPSIGT